MNGIVKHYTEAPASRASLRLVFDSVIDAMRSGQSSLMDRLAAAAASDADLTAGTKCIVLDAGDEDILREQGGFVLTVEWVSLDAIKAMARD